jgi:hypothetical protein
MNRAIVNEKHVGDFRQLLNGAWFVDGDRLIRAVSTGHHKRHALHFAE